MIVKCGHCDADVVIKRDMKRIRFCDFRCERAYKRARTTEQPCQRCGTLFRSLKAAARYCSQSCNMKRINEDIEHQINAAKTASAFNIAKRGTGQGYAKFYGKHLHRHLGEQAVGRPLKRNEVVHHIDNNPKHNHAHNLLVCTQAYHTWLHAEMRRRGIDPAMLLPEESRCYS